MKLLNLICNLLLLSQRINNFILFLLMLINQLINCLNSNESTILFLSLKFWNQYMFNADYYIIVAAYM